MRDRNCLGVSHVSLPVSVAGGSALRAILRQEIGNEKRVRARDRLPRNLAAMQPLPYRRNNVEGVRYG
jgi:hypothetical protein